MNDRVAYLCQGKQSTFSSCESKRKKVWDTPYCRIRYPLEPIESNADFGCTALDEVSEFDLASVTEFLDSSMLDRGRSLLHLLGLRLHFWLGQRRSRMISGYSFTDAAHRSLQAPQTQSMLPVIIAPRIAQCLATCSRVSMSPR